MCSLGELETLVAKLHAENEDAGPFGLEDLVNEPLDPKNLGSPRALAMKDTPLLTTDFYFIGKGDDSARYSALEMDDAVIGHAAGQAGADYAFFRNISDPLVPNVTKSGQTIPEGVRSDWSSLIYETFGLYTSMNGALLAWAALAAGSTSRGG